MKKLPGLIRIIKPNLSTKLKSNIYEFFITKIDQKEKEFSNFQENYNEDQNEMNSIYLKINVQKFKLMSFLFQLILFKILHEENEFEENKIKKEKEVERKIKKIEKKINNSIDSIKFSFSIYNEIFEEKFSSFLNSEENYNQKDIKFKVFLHEREILTSIEPLNIIKRYLFKNHENYLIKSELKEIFEKHFETNEIDIESFHEECIENKEEFIAYFKSDFRKKRIYSEFSNKEKIINELDFKIPKNEENKKIINYFSFNNSIMKNSQSTESNKNQLEYLQIINKDYKFSNAEDNLKNCYYINNKISNDELFEKTTKFQKVKETNNIEDFNIDNTNSELNKTQNFSFSNLKEKLNEKILNKNFINTPNKCTNNNNISFSYNKEKEKEKNPDAKKSNNLLEDSFFIDIEENSILEEKQNEENQEIISSNNLNKDLNLTENSMISIVNKPSNSNSRNLQIMQFNSNNKSTNYSNISNYNNSLLKSINQAPLKDNNIPNGNLGFVSYHSFQAQANSNNNSNLQRNQKKKDPIKSRDIYNVLMNKCSNKSNIKNNKNLNASYSDSDINQNIVNNINSNSLGADFSNVLRQKERQSIDNKSTNNPKNIETLFSEIPIKRNKSLLEPKENETNNNKININNKAYLRRGGINGKLNLTAINVQKMKKEKSKMKTSKMKISIIEKLFDKINEKNPQKIKEKIIDEINNGNFKNNFLKINKEEENSINKNFNEEISLNNNNDNNSEIKEENNSALTEKSQKNEKDSNIKTYLGNNFYLKNSAKKFDNINTNNNLKPLLPKFSKRRTIPNRINYRNKIQKNSSSYYNNILKEIQRTNSTKEQKNKKLNPAENKKINRKSGFELLKSKIRNKIFPLKKMLSISEEPKNLISEEKVFEDTLSNQKTKKKSFSPQSDNKNKSFKFFDVESVIKKEEENSENDLKFLNDSDDEILAMGTPTKNSTQKIRKISMDIESLTNSKSLLNSRNNFIKLIKQIRK